METIRTRVAGLDVHRDRVVGCVRLVDGGGRVTTQRRSFSTMTFGIGELASWLTDRAVTTAVMESTGVYWKPIYYGLESTIDELWLVNATHVKRVPGRKTDVSDAEWLADVAAHGMVRSNQWRAKGDHRVIHGVPVTASLAGDLGHGATEPAHLFAHPTASPIGHRPASRRDPCVLAGPRHDRAPVVGTAPAVLVPHQPRRSTERRQIDQLDGRSVLHPCRPTAARTQRPRRPRLDMHTQGCVGLVDDTERVDRRQADQQLAHARRVRLHRGSPDRQASEPSDSLRNLTVFYAFGFGRARSDWDIGPSTTPRTLTSGRPISSSHMRVGLTSTGRPGLLR